jgi:hypothetical protein
MSARLFVYNADSGLFNLMSDIAHKVFAPATYPCNLCAFTHSPLGMRREWKSFLDSLAGRWSSCIGTNVASSIRTSTTSPCPPFSSRKARAWRACSTPRL